MPGMRRLSLIVLVWLAVAPLRGQTLYFPVADGCRLSYLSRSGMQEDVTLHWDMSHLRTVPLAEGGDRLSYTVRSAGFDGRGWQRQERYVRNGAGIFAVSAEGEAEDYGPQPILPNDGRLEQVDALWRFAGVRQLPVGFRLLGLMRTADREAYWEVHYHVLKAEPVETPAGRFNQSVEVTVVGRIEVGLPTMQWLLVRGRQWYVPGIGLVKELIQFIDVPALGTMSTELTSYSGLAPVNRPQLVLLVDPTDAQDAA